MQLPPFPILTLLASVLLAAALPVHAQQPGKVYRIGTLGTFPPSLSFGDLLGGRGDPVTRESS